LKCGSAANDGVDGDAGADEISGDRRRFRIRSGSRARIFGMSADVKAETRRFSRRT
jgi:hypothetical protein